MQDYWKSFGPKLPPRLLIWETAFPWQYGKKPDVTPYGCLGVWPTSTCQTINGESQTSQWRCISWATARLPRDISFLMRRTEHCISGKMLTFNEKDFGQRQAMTTEPDQKGKRHEVECCHRYKRWSSSRNEETREEEEDTPQEPRKLG